MTKREPVQNNWASFMWIPMIWYLIPPSPNSGDIGMVNGSAQPILRCISPKRRAMMNLHQSPTRMETSCDVRSLPIHLRWSRAQTNRHLRLTIEPWTERSPSQFGSSREVHCTGGGLRELVPIIAQKKTPASSRSFRLPPGREERIAYGRRQRHCVLAIRMARDLSGLPG